MMLLSNKDITLNPFEDTLQLISKNLQTEMNKPQRRLQATHVQKLTLNLPMPLLKIYRQSCIDSHIVILNYTQYISKTAPKHIYIYIRVSSNKFGYILPNVLAEGSDVYSCIFFKKIKSMASFMSSKTVSKSSFDSCAGDFSIPESQCVFAPMPFF